MRYLLAAALVLIALPAAAARLPKSVVPSHYTLLIAPDLNNETFTGDEGLTGCVSG